MCLRRLAHVHQQFLGCAACDELLNRALLVGSTPATAAACPLRCSGGQRSEAGDDTGRDQHGDHNENHGTHRVYMMDMCIALDAVIASENPYVGRELAAAENVDGSLAKACANRGVFFKNQGLP